jgi:outer membrane lipopolysaccharide assembly protein LptE/RlpB
VLKILSLLLVLLLAAGCGYHNPNMLPPEKQDRVLKLYVPIWPNPTNEIRLAFDIHNALQDWLGQSNRFILVNSAGEADYVVNGRINSVSHPARSYDGKDRALALSATLNVDYTVIDTRNGKTVWEAKGLALTETYSLQTDTHKKQALETLVDNLAEQIYIRLYSSIARYEKGKGREK